MKSFVLFLGHPRSGHSIIGALIDAHPNAIIPHEYGVVHKYHKKWSNRDELFAALQKQSAHNAMYSHSRNPRSGSHHVPNQWQGKHSGLTIIGDKYGGSTSHALGNNPDLLDTIQNEIQLPIKFIHVYRNPYDNIATIKHKHKLTMKSKNNFTLEQAIDFYFSLCAKTNVVLDKINSDPKYSVLTIKQEDFVNTTTRQLDRICHYLELPPTIDYLRACSSVVFKSPRITRHSVEWTPELIETVKEKSQAYPQLSSYSYA